MAAEERSNHQTTAASPARQPEMSFGKKFAVITLTSLGVALFLTGRSTRVLAKHLKAPLPSSSPPAAGPSALSPFSALRFLAADQASLNSKEADWRNVPRRIRGGELKRQWARDFRSNRALEQEAAPASLTQTSAELGFNPALHALGAFSMATIVVVASAGGTVYMLGRRWELDGWDDWKMFARYGVRGLVAPLKMRERIEALIPQWAKAGEGPSEGDEQTDGVADVTGWVKELDEEWAEERMRRDRELAGWNETRRRRGVQAFGER